MRPFLLLLLFAVSVSVSFGQILIFFTAKLDGTQEVPAVTTTASGTGTFILNADGTQLTYNITVNGLTMTAAHFHNAFQGTVGAVVKDLSFTNNTASGVWSSSDATQPFDDNRLSELLRGRLYVNVHTAANLDGEIRGQVLLPGPVTFTAKLEGAQENPPVTTNAGGTGSVRLNANGTISYDITVTGLTTTAQHFHNAPVGTNGSVVKDISLTNNTGSGTWTFSDPTQPLDGIMLRALVRGQLYMNAHTSANLGGEIRGQVLLQPGLVFTANLQGSQEVPAVPTDATGTAYFILGAEGTQLDTRIVVNGLTATAAHFHNAEAGVVGNIVADLDPDPIQSGVWSSSDPVNPFTDALLIELLHGRLYVNFHTSANPDGEIRGQILLASAVGFAANLDGTQEVPPVMTDASGTGYTVFNTDGSASYGLTVTGLTPTASHFHNAPVGTPGDVVKDIALTNNSSYGTWTSGDATQPLTDYLMVELFTSRLYMNVYTSANQGGEIRGQVGPVASELGGPTSVEQISDIVPVNFILEQNYPNPFNPATVIGYQLPVSGRVSLKVYNALGQEVVMLVDEIQPAGAYRATFDASGLASGVYLYRLSAPEGFVTARRMVLIK